LALQGQGDVAINSPQLPENDLFLPHLARQERLQGLFFGLASESLTGRQTYKSFAEAVFEYTRDSYL